MKEWPTPKNLKKLRGFLGLTGYYRCFVQGYGSIAAPLTKLLKKDAFAWSLEAHEAFETLKNTMVSLPVLAAPNFSELFVVESDASGFGIGAVLMQEQHPIAFFSKGLSEKTKLKSVYERELMALVLAILKWRHYLLGRKFLVRTDQRSLQFLADQRLITSEQQKWWSKLVGFHFDIQFKPGAENRVADALSRRISAMELQAFTVPFIVQEDEMDKSVFQDIQLQRIISDILNKPDSHPGYSLSHGRLFYKGS